MRVVVKLGVSVKKLLLVLWRRVRVREECLQFVSGGGPRDRHCSCNGRNLYCSKPMRVPENRVELPTLAHCGRLGRASLEVRSSAINGAIFHDAAEVPAAERQS